MIVVRRGRGEIMFVYTIWDIAFVALLAIGIIVFIIGCIALAIKEIAVKAGTKVNEINSEDWSDEE